MPELRSIVIVYASCLCSIAVVCHLNDTPLDRNSIESTAIRTSTCSHLRDSMGILCTLTEPGSGTVYTGVLGKSAHFMSDQSSVTSTLKGCCPILHNTETGVTLYVMGATLRGIVCIDSNVCVTIPSESPETHNKRLMQQYPLEFLCAPLKQAFGWRRWPRPGINGPSCPGLYYGHSSWPVGTHINSDRTLLLDMATREIRDSGITNEQRRLCERLLNYYCSCLQCRRLHMNTDEFYRQLEPPCRELCVLCRKK